MKYIVIGLGYFGTSLATKLTTLGHEVIGIDHNSIRVNELKDSITRVMILDSTKQNALEALPLQDADAVLVTIGEDVGSSILTLSILRKLDIKRLIGRAINLVHHDILKELGIEEIIHPEEDTAEIVTSLLMIRNAVSILPVNDKVILVELKLPRSYIGHNLDAINLEMRFGIKPVAVKIAPKEKGFDKLLKKDFQVDIGCDRLRPIRENDRLLLIGDINSIKRFIE